MESFKKRYTQTWLAACWHRIAPSLTIRKSFLDASVFMDLRDNIDDCTRSKTELEQREWPDLLLPELVEGPVWDVGANVGLFSVRTASLGRPCVAFELSPKACRLLCRTMLESGLDFQIVNSALTTTPRHYLPPYTSNPKNSLKFMENRGMRSLTFLEAAQLYGVPRLLKMDIEGGEREFFDCPEFKKWLIEQGIVWLVEVHHRRLGCKPEWQDVPHALVSDGLSTLHYIYAGDQAEVERLRNLLMDRNPKFQAV